MESKWHSIIVFENICIDTLGIILAIWNKLESEAGKIWRGGCGSRMEVFTKLAEPRCHRLQSVISLEL